MAGHSKWKNIRHKKAKEDAKKGKAFTRLSKEITILVKASNNGDVNTNPRLRLLVEKGREVNMPKENVERAIKKGLGQIEGANYEPVTYEGYGPDGVALIIEALTDNRNRTASDFRHFFTKHGGRLADSGSVAWMFESKGLLEIDSNGINEDQLLEQFLNANADIENIKFDEEEGIATIQANVDSLESVRVIADQLGFKIKSVNVGWIAKSPIAITSGEEAEEQLLSFLDGLDELDDVQEIYTNLE